MAARGIKEEELIVGREIRNHRGHLVVSILLLKRRKLEGRKDEPLRKQ